MLEQIRVTPGKHASLASRNSSQRFGLEHKQDAEEMLEELIAELAVLHDRLWAEATRSLLLVLQGMDASGKDGTIRKVFTGVNPQGCRVTSFKQPTGHELAHDYLWRVHEACPARGEIGIWNRSHYEDLVTVKVLGLVPPEAVARRARHVREFERMLTDEGTAVVKVFLQISKDEQRARLQSRLDDPEKNWKFQSSDLAVRDRWDDFMAAYDEAITETSTEWAPWYVVPANHKYVRNVAVAKLLVEKLRELEPRLPPADPALAEVTVE